jgi:hypothetical protein
MPPTGEPAARVTGTDAAALRILARSIVRELNGRGYGLRHVIALAAELIGLACDFVRSNRGGAIGGRRFVALEPGIIENTDSER